MSRSESSVSRLRDRLDRFEEPMNVRKGVDEEKLVLGDERGDVLVDAEDIDDDEGADADADDDEYPDCDAAGDVDAVIVSAGGVGTDCADADDEGDNHIPDNQLCSRRLGSCRDDPYLSHDTSSPSSPTRAISHQTH
jgi:hypothetical protein